MGFFSKLFGQNKTKKTGTSPEAGQVKTVQSPFTEGQQSANLTGGGEVPLDANPPATQKWWQEGQAASYRSGQSMDTFIFPDEGAKQKDPEINVTGSYDGNQSLSDENGVIKPEVRGGLFRRRRSSAELLKSDVHITEKKG